MKFRATIIEAGVMRQFATIVTTLAKLSKTFILRIREDRIIFIVLEDQIVPYRMPIWSILDRNEFFNTYVMDGDPDNNEIYFEISSDLLSSSLNSLKLSSTVSSLKIKLTDKSAPCLTLEMEISTSSTNTQICTHDIPISVIQKTDWSEFQEPDEIIYDMSIEMPSLKIVKNIVDKMKKFSTKVTVIASNNGSLSLLVTSMAATVQTYFKDLKVFPDKCAVSDDPKASVCVDIKKLYQFLTCDVINSSQILCNIVTDRVLHLNLEHTGFHLNYYVMALEE